VHAHTHTYICFIYETVTLQWLGELQVPSVVWHAHVYKTEEWCLKHCLPLDNSTIELFNLHSITH